MENGYKKSAIVVGAGVAGLTASVLLDEQGYDVTLVEKKVIGGGRTYSFEDKKTGCLVDNGQHLMIGAYHETLRLLERVGAKHNVEFHVPTVVPLFNKEFERADFVLNAGKPPFNLVKAVFGFSHFSFSEKFKFLKLGLRLKKIAKGKAPLPKRQTVAEWLQGLGQTPNMIQNFWEVFCLATLNESTAVASADLMVEVLARSYFGGPQDGFLVFPKKGLSEVLVDPVLEYLKLRGHQVFPKVGVKEVQILDGKVQGLVDDTGNKLTADVYVLAVPHHQITPLLPRAFVDSHPQLSELHNLKSSPIVSINLFFDREVMLETFVGSSDTRTHWFFNKNRIHQMSDDVFHVMGVISAGQDLLDLPKRDLLEIALTDLKKLCPQALDAELIHSLINIERQATFSCDVNSQKARPDQKVLQNLYILGDWTNTGLPGTIEGAALSAALAFSQNSESQAHS